MSALDRIVALSAEQRALWAKGRLSEAEQGRLIDIRSHLEQLWDQRRREKAGARGLGHALARQARNSYRRGRAQRRPGAASRSY